MSYEELLIEADKQGLTVKELALRSADGRCNGKRIAIRRDIPTLAKKADVLAEEMGHYFTSVGRIVEQNTVEDVKQERKARLWGYDKRIGLFGLIRAFNAHCEGLHDIAEYLDVSEDSLSEALECYRQKYGICVRVDNYMIYFEPYLHVYTFFVPE